VKQFAWDNFAKTPELMAAGEAAARVALPKIKAALTPTETIPTVQSAAYR
jgi:hypothetical protein